ncbi:MAG TPA: helix-turn-helix transcriptional regulator, partial [Polyangia bacterium]
RHAGALAAGATLAPFRREAVVVIEALSPFDVPPGEVAFEPGARNDPGREQLRAWRRGEAPLPPALLHGLLLPGSPEPGACVVLWPDGRSARFLSGGVPLLGGAVARLPPSRRQNGRIETLLAILALAGPGGLDEATSFSRAYGFTYVPGVHRGVFDVLVHRARAAVDGLATLSRGPGRLALTATRPLLLFDPRASRSTTDRVLRLLAEQGRASAKEAAARLGLSLRAAQGALSELAGSQACVVERDGRSVTYAVEDSVFSEPTGRLSRGQVNRRGEFGAAGA